MLTGVPSIVVVDSWLLSDDSLVALGAGAAGSGSGSATVATDSGSGTTSSGAGSEAKFSGSASGVCSSSFRKAVTEGFRASGQTDDLATQVAG